MNTQYDEVNGNVEEEPDRFYCGTCDGVRYFDGPDDTCGFCESTRTYLWVDGEGCGEIHDLPGYFRGAYYAGENIPKIYTNYAGELVEVEYVSTFNGWGDNDYGSHTVSLWIAPANESRQCVGQFFYGVDGRA